MLGEVLLQYQCWLFQYFSGGMNPEQECIALSLSEMGTGQAAPLTFLAQNRILKQRSAYLRAASKQVQPMTGSFKYTYANLGP